MCNTYLDHFHSPSCGHPIFFLQMRCSNNMQYFIADFLNTTLTRFYSSQTLDEALVNQAVEVLQRACRRLASCHWVQPSQGSREVIRPCASSDSADTVSQDDLCHHRNCHAKFKQCTSSSKREIESDPFPQHQVLLVCDQCPLFSNARLTRKQSNFSQAQGTVKTSSSTMAELRSTSFSLQDAYSTGCQPLLSANYSGTAPNAYRLLSAETRWHLFR